MPVCHLCKEDLPKAEFSGSQLKKKAAERSCSACLAAAEMQAKMDSTKIPSDLFAPDDASSELCKVETWPGVGRVLTAARAFKVGEIVLREPPVLSWQVDDVGQLISSFLALSPAEQKDVLEMATPSVDADLDMVADPATRGEILAARKEREAARRAIAEELAEAYVPNPRLLELIEAVLYRADCNAHAFKAGEVGLFPLAALANHSCDPTCGHSTRTNDEMRFYAARPIAKGEEVSITYLPDLWSTPREERRRTLLLQKLFYCRCARCTAPERCRGLRCVTITTAALEAKEGEGAPCDGVAMHSDGGSAARAAAAANEKEGGGGRWRCMSCKQEVSDEGMAKRLAAEAELAAKVKALIESAPFQPPPPLQQQDEHKGPCPPVDKVALAAAYEEVQALLSAVREELSPSHYLGPRLLQALIGAPGLEPMMLASASAQALAWLECATAGCFSNACGRAGVTRHEPSAELVGEAATAVLASARVATKELVAIGAVIASRYLPWAVRQFGNEDRSVKAMRAVLDKVTPPKKSDPESQAA